MHVHRGPDSFPVAEDTPRDVRVERQSNLRNVRVYAEFVKSLADLTSSPSVRTPTVFVPPQSEQTAVQVAALV